LKNYLAQKSFGNLEPDRTGLHHLELLAFLAENVGSYRKLSTAARGYYLAAYAPKSPQQGLFSSQPESEEQAFARTFASSGSKTGIL
jgi:inorganic triphosphatase YgiF